MSDCLGNLDREDEVLGSAGCPVVNRARSWAGIKSRINFNRVKVLCVEGKVIAGAHSFWIKCSPPACGCESGCAKQDRWLAHDGKYTRELF